MRTHEQAPPDPGFRDRLRALADAAAAMRDARRARASARDGTGMAARRRLPAGTSALRAATQTGRRGPHELWTQFDAAVQQLNQAGASDNLGDVVDAYAAVAQAASELADGLHAAGE